MIFMDVYRVLWILMALKPWGTWWQWYTMMHHWIILPADKPAFHPVVQGKSKGWCQRYNWSTVNPTVVKASLRLIFGSLASGNQTSQWKIHHLYISMIFPFTLPINFGDFAKNHGWLLGYVSYVPQKLLTTLLDHPRMTQPPSSDRSWEALTIRSICQIGQPIWLWFSVACWACWSGNPGMTWTWAEWPWTLLEEGDFPCCCMPSHIIEWYMMYMICHI